MKRFLTAGRAVLAVCLSVGAAGTAAARQLQTFKLVNFRRYTIRHLFVRLDGTKWSKNWRRYQVRPNDSKAGLYVSRPGASCTGKVWVRTLQQRRVAAHRPILSRPPLAGHFPARTAGLSPPVSGREQSSRCMDED